MKITICGSIAFIDEMEAAKRELEQFGHEVKLPPSEMTDAEGKAILSKDVYAIRKSSNTVDDWVWEKKTEAMKNHFDKVAWSDAILVLNHTKNNVAHYVGANTLLEMGLAFHQGKKIFLLNPIPEISYKEELLGMKPTVLNSDLSLIV